MILTNYWACRSIIVGRAIVDCSYSMFALEDTLARVLYRVHIVLKITFYVDDVFGRLLAVRIVRIQNAVV
jgi:hypothetical protein